MAVVVIPRYFNPTLVVTSLGTIATFRNGQGLAMEFRIERSIKSTPDTCGLSICNMDPIRAVGMGAIFSQLGVSQVTVAGGYELVVAGMFLGDVRRFRSARRSGPDVWTDIDADDSGDAFSDVPIRVSTFQMTAAEMIGVAATAMGVVQSPSVAEVIATGDYTRQGPFGCVMTGHARDLLDAACRRLGCRWWLRDKQLFLARLGLADKTRPAVLITPSAVVGDVSIGGSGELSVPMMFDPNVVPGGQVSYLGSLFRVEHVVHSGGTRGSLWVSEIEGRVL